MLKLLALIAQMCATQANASPSWAWSYMPKKPDGIDAFLTRERETH